MSNKNKDIQEERLKNELSKLQANMPSELAPVGNAANLLSMMSDLTDIVERVNDTLVDRVGHLEERVLEIVDTIIARGNVSIDISNRVTKLEGDASCCLREIGKLKSKHEWIGDALMEHRNRLGDVEEEMTGVQSKISDVVSAIPKH